MKGTGHSERDYLMNPIRYHSDTCAVLTMLEFGMYEFWPTYPVDNSLRQNILHIVTISLTRGWPSLNNVSTKFPFDRLLRTLATCLADGASANSPMPGRERFFPVSIWQNLVWDSIMATAVFPRTFVAPVWLLFLLHGADRDFTLKFEQTSNFSARDKQGKLVLLTGQWGANKSQVHSPMQIHRGEGEPASEDPDDGKILGLAQGQNWSVSLKELIYFWFPTYAERFRRIYDLYESNVDIPMERVSNLRRELGFDPECWQTQTWNNSQHLLEHNLEGTSWILEQPGYKSDEEWF